MRMAIRTCLCWLESERTFDVTSTICPMHSGTRTMPMEGEKCTHSIFVWPHYQSVHIERIKRQTKTFDSWDLFNEHDSRASLSASRRTISNFLFEFMDRWRNLRACLHLTLSLWSSFHRFFAWLKLLRSEKPTVTLRLDHVSSAWSFLFSNQLVAFIQRASFYATVYDETADATAHDHQSNIYFLRCVSLCSIWSDLVLETPINPRVDRKQSIHSRF